MKIVSDLTRFFLCPFQCLLDINHQLPTPSEKMNAQVFKPLCELNTVNDWINLEAWGKPSALRAEALTDELYHVLQQQHIHHLELHINLNDKKLTTDNLYALLCLADRLEHLRLTIYCSNRLIDNQKMHLSPLSTKANTLLEWVKIPAKIDSAINNQLSALKTQQSATLIEAGFSFNTEEQDFEQFIPPIGLLISYAWICLKAGAHDLGCQVLTEILAHSSLSLEQHEQLFMQLQLIRFLSHQYLLVVEEAFPDTFYTLKAADITHLYFIKAYAATLTRHLSVADQYFQKAGVNEQLPMTDETSLFRLNLYALFLVLTHQIKKALDLELAIKLFIAKNNIHNLGLKYVNFINIARVYKKLGQFNESISHYEKAYEELQGGGFTPSDYIYYNINFASLYEAAGQPEKAFYFWLKAALHWQTFPNPYALAWRPRLIVCQESILTILNPLSIETVDDFFLQKLQALMPAIPLRINQTDLPLVQFIADNKASHPMAFVTNGLILYRAEKTAKDSVYAHKALHQCLSQIIRSLLAVSDKELSLIIDSRYETFYPQSEVDCLLLNLLSGCTQFYFEGHYFSMTERQYPISPQVRMKLVQSIQSIETMGNKLKINYRRSFLNQYIEESDEIAFIQQLQEQSGLHLHHLSNEDYQLFKRLWSKKIMSACLEA